MSVLSGVLTGIYNKHSNIRTAIRKIEPIVEISNGKWVGGMTQNKTHTHCSPIF